VSKRYRKKPVVIEALRFTGTPGGIAAAEKFCGGCFFSDNQPRIMTLEGVMFVSEGDYIIKGVQGEFYSCKPDIFKQTYEEVRGE